MSWDLERERERGRSGHGQQWAWWEYEGGIAVQGIRERGSATARLEWCVPHACMQLGPVARKDATDDSAPGRSAVLGSLGCVVQASTAGRYHAAQVQCPLRPERRDQNRRLPGAPHKALPWDCHSRGVQPGPVPRSSHPVTAPVVYALPACPVACPVPVDGSRAACPSLCLLSPSLSLQCGRIQFRLYLFLYQA